MSDRTSMCVLDSILGSPLTIDMFKLKEHKCRDRERTALCERPIKKNHVWTRFEASS